MEYDDYLVCGGIVCILWMAIEVIRTHRRDNRIYGKGWRKKARKEREEWLRKTFGE